MSYTRILTKRGFGGTGYHEIHVTVMVSNTENYLMMFLVLHSHLPMFLYRKSQGVPHFDNSWSLGFIPEPEDTSPSRWSYSLCVVCSSFSALHLQQKNAAKVGVGSGIIFFERYVISSL